MQKYPAANTKNAAGIFQGGFQMPKGFPLRGSCSRKATDEVSVAQRRLAYRKVFTALRAYTSFVTASPSPLPL